MPFEGRNVSCKLRGRFANHTGVDIFPGLRQNDEVECLDDTLGPMRGGPPRPDQSLDRCQAERADRAVQAVGHRAGSIGVDGECPAFAGLVDSSQACCGGVSHVHWTAPDRGAAHDGFANAARSAKIATMADSSINHMRGLKCWRMRSTTSDVLLTGSNIGCRHGRRQRIFSVLCRENIPAVSSSI
jgi:hypothetical protein